ncbi:MAG: DUF1616 domain-containing protein [Firmicutes bacterium]|nr:DUF1616 domain-containing protein [Bacillota bacterium]
MKLTVKNEFPAIVGISLLVVLVVTLFDFQSLRVILGLPFVLFLPGYTLIAALFPRSDDLDGIERVALSFGLSIAVVPLIGLALNYTPWGIRLYPILVSLTAFIFLMSWVGWYRRMKLPGDERFKIVLEADFKWSEQSRLDKVLSVLLVGAVLFAVGTLYYVITTPKTGEKFTEFYILGPGGMAEGYPRELKPGEDGKVIVGVVNHEYEKVVYRVEVVMNGHLEKEVHPVTLEHEEKWERPLVFSAHTPQKNLKVEFRLFREGDGEPYRKLHLWVDVLPDD